jgi:hypothetical protein
MTSIILTGDPTVGFTAVGPLDKSDDVSGIGEWARAKFGGADWFELSLHGPSDPTGDVVVFAGDIGCKFRFHGPFVDVPTAEEWACGDSDQPICVFTLEPIDREEFAV